MHAMATEYMVVSLQGLVGEGTVVLVLKPKLFTAWSTESTSFFTDSNSSFAMISHLRSDPSKAAFPDTWALLVVCMHVKSVVSILDKISNRIES
jgi:hypothetical protein